MNQDIKAYIEAQCLRMGLTPTSPQIAPLQETCFIGGNHWVSIDKVGVVSHFSMTVFEPKTEFYFPIPETLRGFMQVCNVLKVFHDHTEAP